MSADLLEIFDTLLIIMPWFLAGIMTHRVISMRKSVLQEMTKLNEKIDLIFKQHGK